MTPEEQVLDAARARAAALAAGDGEVLEALLHREFRWTAHVGETYSRAEYVRRNTEGHTVWRSQDLLEPEVVMVGDVAVLYGRVRDVVVGDGEDVVFLMPVTQVWVRVDGDWQCLTGHAGPRLP